MYASYHCAFCVCTCIYIVAVHWCVFFSILQCVLQCVLQCMLRVCCKVCLCCKVCCGVCCRVCCRVYCNLCCRVVPCVAMEHGRDHHHDDLTLQQRAAVCSSVMPRGAVCCLQPLHHVPCAVAADTRPPVSRCLPLPLTSTTAARPFWAAM